MADERWTRALLAHLHGVTVDAIEQVGSDIRIIARAVARRASCPGCATVSRRVHSRYERRVADGAIGGRAVEIRLTVRRFRCVDAFCGRVTFVEQVRGLTFRYGRRSLGLQALSRRVALMLAGRAGARLAAWVGSAVSRSTLLRLIRATPPPVARRLMQNGADVVPGPCVQRPRVRYDFGYLKSMVTAGGVGAASAYIVLVTGRAVRTG